MTKCIMPLPIMPATPPGGLFGPDAFVPFWSDPGYDTPPDITFPNLGDGLVPINAGLPTMGLAPLPSEAWDEINRILAEPELGGAAGGRPSIPSLGSLASGPATLTSPPGTKQMPEIMPARPRPRPLVPESAKNPFVTVESGEEVIHRLYGNVPRYKISVDLRPRFKVGDPHPTIPGLYYAGGGNWRSGYANEIGSQIHVGYGGKGKKIYRNVGGIEVGGRGAPRRIGGILGKVLDLLIIAAGVILAGALIYGAVLAVTAAAAFVTGVVVPFIVAAAAAISRAVAPYSGLVYSRLYFLWPAGVAFATNYLTTPHFSTATNELVTLLINWYRSQDWSRFEGVIDRRIIPYCPPWKGKLPLYT